MKKILLLSISLISFLFSQENNIMIKLNSQEVNLTKSNENDSVIFYDLNANKNIEKNLFEYCIIEEQKRTNKINLFCSHKNKRTYFTEISGFVNPDSNLMTYSIFYTLKDLDNEINKIKGE